MPFTGLVRPVRQDSMGSIHAGLNRGNSCTNLLSHCTSPREKSFSEQSNPLSPHSDSTSPSPRPSPRRTPDINVQEEESTVHAAVGPSGDAKIITNDSSNTLAAGDLSGCSAPPNTPFGAKTALHQIDELDEEGLEEEKLSSNGTITSDDPNLDKESSTESEQESPLTSNGSSELFNDGPSSEQSLVEESADKESEVHDEEKQTVSNAASEVSHEHSDGGDQSKQIQYIPNDAQIHSTITSSSLPKSSDSSINQQPYLQKQSKQNEPQSESQSDVKDEKQTQSSSQSLTKDDQTVSTSQLYFKHEDTNKNQQATGISPQPVANETLQETSQNPDEKVQETSQNLQNKEEIVQETLQKPGGSPLIQDGQNKKAGAGFAKAQYLKTAFFEASVESDTPVTEDGDNLKVPMSASADMKTPLLEASAGLKKQTKIYRPPLKRTISNLSSMSICNLLIFLL